MLSKEAACYDARVVKKFWLAPATLLLLACNPPPPPHPALSPGTAETLLRYDSRAAAHLQTLKHQDPTCIYRVVLPDQTAHPQSISVEHIAFCSGRNDLKAFDTRAEFEWDKAAGKWTLAHLGG